MNNMQFYLDIWVQLNEVLKVLKVDAGEYESLIGFVNVMQQLWFSLPLCSPLQSFYTTKDWHYVIWIFAMSSTYENIEMVTFAWVGLNVSQVIDSILIWIAMNQTYGSLFPSRSKTKSNCEILK